MPGRKVRIFTPFVLTKKTPNGLETFHAHVPFVAGVTYARGGGGTP